MKVEIEVISKEIIRPSSPTLTHLCHYQLSFIDQKQNPKDNSCIFFYSKSDGDMMKVEIEVISKEIIRPSSPTLTHLCHYQLSFIDQKQNPKDNSCIFFYSKSDGDVIAKSNKLKQSLSKLLTSYYPLAGRIKDNISVDCNDEGAY
ncbi:vinorine synthase [Quercus suber]|uniref:Vinorine synthase n=1 Tax=Quercus suber TaxID=58331 RepID=A0AAW0L1C0_QUESU